MLIAQILMFAVQPAAPVLPLPPPPPPAAEHHYNPGSRTVHTTYTCMDGARSVTLQYEQVPKGKVSAMSRNGRLASLKVVDEVNRLIERFPRSPASTPNAAARTTASSCQGTSERRK